jgi:peptidylprolyl isomerase
MKKMIAVLAVLALFVAVAMAQDTTKVKPNEEVKAKVEAKADTVKAKVEAKKEAAKAKAETAKSKKTTEAKKAEESAKMKGKGAAEAAGKEVNTKSGLKYVDRVVGKGEEAVPGAKVDVHYTGWLYVNGQKGKKFDSSVERGTPISFTLGNREVIKGWDEGIAGMKVGGKRTLIIPPDLAYGSQSVGGGLIPPNSTLIFDVELMKVTK